MTSRLERFLAAGAVATLAIACGSRLRVDTNRMRTVESIAVVTFVGNRVVQPPSHPGQIDPPLPSDPSLATSERIFATGIPEFLDALRRTERFRVVDPATVLAAEAYRAFPFLSGTNASQAQLAEHWRLVQPQDGEKIAALLREIDADAALITFWRFTLDYELRGVGVESASPRAHLRAWLVDRSGTVVADDEIDVRSDQRIALHQQRYDGRSLPPLYTDPIETCAVRLVADLSNARAQGREAAPTGTPESTPDAGAAP